MVGEKKPLVTAGDERAWLRGRLRTGNAREWLEMGVRRIARTAADGVGAREWLEMGGEKKPLEISELGCADSCGREMGAENCADGCGRRGCKGVATWRAGGGYKYIARLEHFYKLLTKCCNLPYKWC